MSEDEEPPVAKMIQASAAFDGRIDSWKTRPESTKAIPTDGGIVMTMTREERVLRVINGPDVDYLPSQITAIQTARVPSVSGRIGLSYRAGQVLVIAGK